jgi:hypothetical protein
MTLDWILGWWNLVFIAPFFVAMVYLGLYALTGIGDGDADGDAHADAGAHGDVDADADAELDADADVDAEGDADHDHDAEHVGGSYFSAALSWLGVGRVPVSLLMIVMLLTWGCAGFVTNAILHQRAADGWPMARWSIPIALLCAVMVTRGVSAMIIRYLPLNETYVRRRSELVGRTGEAILPIDHTFGLVAVRDDSGDLYQLACRVGENVSPIEKGARVRLVAYDAKAQSYFVAQIEPVSGRST